MGDPRTFETPWGRVALDDDEHGDLTITRFGPLDGVDGALMLRFNRADDTLHIFPREGESKGGQHAYSKLLEIRLDRGSTGWDPEDPVSETDRGEIRLNGFPEGLGVVVGYGLGFPRNYQSLAREMEVQTSCSVLHLSGGPTRVDGEVLYMNVKAFKAYVHKVDLHRQRAQDVAWRLNSTEAYNTVATASGKPLRTPRPGTLPIKKAMTEVVSGATDMDATDRDELLMLALSETRAAAVNNPATLGRLRDDIDLVTLDVLIQQFAAALQGPGRAREGTWQAFFEKNRFALQQLFSAPIAYIGAQVEVRIPALGGAGMRRPDFLLVNSIARTAYLIEIKTPTTALMATAAYRGNAGAEVHAAHSELAGSVAQLQAQVQSARTDLAAILGNTPGAPRVDVGIIRGAVIAGVLANLSETQRQSFLRYRDGLIGIDILTYDEVLERLRTLHEMLA